MKKINEILLKEYKSFSEWESSVETIADATEKGEAMEHLVYFYLKSNSQYYDIKEIYMEDEIPEAIRIKLKLERKDNGVDGVIVRNDGKTIAYQVKFRTAHAVPTAQDLSTFWAESEYADMRLICANCTNLPKVSSKKKNQMSILLDTFMELDSLFFDSFLAYLKGDSNSSIIRTKATPDGDHSYQQELIDQIVTGLSTNDRGKFIAACGIGKTLIAMWVHEKLKANTVLFVVPSLALIKQTLDSWVQNCNIPFSFLCVCSDSSVATLEEDDINTISSDVDFPVTTNPSDIQKFLSGSSEKKVIFVTYNSLDAISNALCDTNYNFDLGIFDESHRTAGTKDSLMFVYGMEDKYIPITKRLFMTATERLVFPRLKANISNIDNTIFSMDDVSKYGPTLATLNFGQAIEKGIICDYKIVVCMITENDIAELVSRRNIVTTELGEHSSSANIEVLLKEVLIGKVMKELDVKKVISYHAYVKSARAFVNGGTGLHAVGDIIDDIIADTANNSTYTNHVNGTMSAGERKEILTTFANSDRGLISNAKCLTEGVDVPAIDAVYFVDPKNSMVDIVQAVGRALRKSSTKKSNCSYIVIPIVVPNNTSLFSHIAPNNFDTLHNVIQAMRSQDSSLADIIDQINFSAATGSLGKGSSTMPPKILILPYSKMGIKDFENSLTLRIAEVNKNPSENKTASIWTETTPKARKSEMKRVFVSIGDYTLDAYLNSLVMPTLKKFTDTDAEMDGANLKVNHNNVSHAVRMGVISKEGKKYKMTLLGKSLLTNSSLYPSISKEQLLKYYCINKEDNSILFPYRAILKIFLEFDYITRFEFLYCIYSMRNTSDSAVQEAISRINYLRETYPNIDILSEANKEKILDIINTKYDVQFGFKDIWTSRTTTYNQFNYFKKHLWGFDNIFITSESKSDKEKIRINPGVKSSIQELLDLTSAIEIPASCKDISTLEDMYGKRICSTTL
ncbi:TPA: DEAD/DEAH box helicase family protein [Streptococcus equi subsp. zooepidemicus]|nr:DEAD/DEAH box helicase family protein [Streptococcus equi subsp. zooepidemicus]